MLKTYTQSAATTKKPKDSVLDAFDGQMVVANINDTQTQYSMQIIVETLSLLQTMIISCFFYLLPSFFFLCVGGALLSQSFCVWFGLLFCCHSLQHSHNMLQHNNQITCLTWFSFGINGLWIFVLPNDKSIMDKLRHENKYYFRIKKSRWQ